jgi:hypothetical protein
VGASGNADTTEMTIVCPKCMHKAADEERVCPRCSTILLSPEQRQALVHRPTNGERKGSPRRSESTAKASGSPTTGLATSVDPSDALREALEYLETKGDNPPPRRRRYIPEAATIGATVAVAIGVGLFFGLTGSHASPSDTTSTPTTAANPANAAIFQFNGAGASTTGPFTSPSAFTLGYRLTCTENLTTAVKFELLRAGHVVDAISSDIGSKQEDNTDPAFGGAGTFTISVNAPSSCDWTVSGTS